MRREKKNYIIVLLKWTIGTIGSGLFVLGSWDEFKRCVYALPAALNPKAPLYAILIGIVLIVIRIFLERKSKKAILVHQAYTIALYFTAIFIVVPLASIVDSLGSGRLRVGLNDYLILCIGILSYIFCWKIKKKVDKEI